MTTCGSRVSFFSAGFFWLFRVRSSCKNHTQSTWYRKALKTFPMLRLLFWQADLRGLIHLGDHGADQVVGVADERPSIAVSSLPAVHGFSSSEHDVEVRHEAGAGHKHTKTQCEKKKDITVIFLTNLSAFLHNLLLAATVDSFVRVRLLLHLLHLLLRLLLLCLQVLLVETLQQEENTQFYTSSSKIYNVLLTMFLYL